MKSINDIHLTGIVVSVSEPCPDKNYTVFTIAHNYGGGRRPLFMRCFSPRRNAVAKLDVVCITGYLRAREDGVEAYVKDIEKPEE